MLIREFVATSDELINCVNGIIVKMQRNVLLYCVLEKREEEKIN
jgi:hypothetical protein